MPMVPPDEAGLSQITDECRNEPAELTAEGATTSQSPAHHAM